jgi:hypothetical protein
VSQASPDRHYCSAEYELSSILARLADLERDVMRLNRMEFTVEEMETLPALHTKQGWRKKGKRA